MGLIVDPLRSILLELMVKGFSVTLFEQNIGNVPYWVIELNKIIPKSLIGPKAIHFRSIMPQDQKDPGCFDMWLYQALLMFRDRLPTFLSKISEGKEHSEHVEGPIPETEDFDWPEETLN